MTAFLTAVAAQPFDQIADADADVHDQVVVSIEAARVRREVARLPKVEREVIKLRYGLDCQPLSHRQIARRLGVSVGTSWNIERRALELLRDAYVAEGAA